MNVKIYVATHQPCDELLKIKDPIYIPIHCGKEIYSSSETGYIPDLGDNTGLNISSKNKNYCELTALYWIWKNDSSQPNDIVGLNHYRRYFREPTPEGEPEILLGKETIEKWLTGCDFITNGSGTDGHVYLSEEKSTYNAYCQTHNKIDIDNMLDGISRVAPDLFDSINYQLKQTSGMCPSNLFITRKKYLDEYSDFLFSVLSYVESVTDLTNSQYQGYGGRVFGFLAERIFRPWLISKGYVGRCGYSLDWEKYSGYVWR